ncbi:alpha/beta fold hydrolase [Mesorhizobium sp. CAU 1741]|uniref:alpha/beta fold hydrolase n=1 Tax=Mesorhizobium sp. CAU 1741 TaxID=3140366 RepID=UPI00325BB9DC
MLYVIFGVAVALVAAALLVAAYLAHVTRRIARRAEKAVPAMGKFVDINGNRIHYVERGEGRPILMIHGLGGTLHHLRRPLMESFGDGYRLIAIDRAGSGYSMAAPGFGGTLAEQARQVAGVIAALGLEKPLLVGHSLGGAVALATALDHPDKISGLALISPLTRFEPQLPAEFKPLAIESPLRRRLVAHTIAVPMSVKNAPMVLDRVFGPQQPPEDYAVAGGAMVSLRPQHFYATSTDLVGSRRDLAQYEARYAELSMPVGILFGTEDRVLDYQRQGVAMTERIAGLDLEIVDGVGHMPQFAVTDRVVAFIRRIAERAFTLA